MRRVNESDKSDMNKAKSWVKEGWKEGFKRKRALLHREHQQSSRWRGREW